MENRGLLFIPDISGFTRFVSETEIDHSRRIIEELLEVLIKANDIGLEISEIEGDAILFYRYGEPPALEDLYHQVEKMFRTFHQSIISYDHLKYCQCKACIGAVNLSLKIITHYGEFTDYNVRNFRKLIGKDIIVAHQLLKNDIQQHEYWLVTKRLAPDQPEHLETWMEWNTSVKQTETGDIPFHYTQLTHLKDALDAGQGAELDLSDKTKVISLAHDYNTDIITLFHATGDFQYRSRWRDGVRQVEEVDHFLPRIGMRCRCVMDNGTITTFASSYTYQADRIVFSETEESSGNVTRYILEKTGVQKSRLTLERYVRSGFFPQLSYSLFRKSKEKLSLERSLDNLKALTSELRVPSAVLE